MHACTSCGIVNDDGQPTDLALLPDTYRLPADHDQIRTDLIDVITHGINGHPRGQQTRPGPSELGTPCQRRLGYKLLGTPESNTDRGAAWKPTVGTAVHTWLEQTFRDYNNRHKIERFYLEQKLVVGELDGKPLKGTADVYDRAFATVIDWKIVGKDALRRYVINGPGEQYRRQGHLYGHGYRLLGLPVERVAIALLPQNGELRDLHLWSEPYDEALALETLARAEGIATLVNAAGKTALTLLPTADAFCNYCPYRLPAATDLTEACPGHAQIPAVAPAPAA